jgi:acyl-[acyl-carrier-protein]-phospholipid O-acyltransferase/long-chain-fatty-acid--[acyl-carrier-protein] ligase
MDLRFGSRAAKVAGHWIRGTGSGRLPHRAGAMAQSFSPEQAQTTLFAGLLAAAHRHGATRTIVEDADGTTLTYRKLILASLVIGGRLARETQKGEAVGLLLPNAAGLLVTLLGLNAFGRVAAVLNFTAGKRQIASALVTARVSTVLTSRRFLEAAKLEELADVIRKTEYLPGHRVRLVALEDVRTSLSVRDKALGALRATSARIFGRAPTNNPTAPAVILFTSGTEGVPKGVVLTNANLMANTFQILDHMRDIFGPDEIVLNPLPMFHCFGLTAATLAPLFGGVKIVLYPSPLHYRQVPKVVQRVKATVMLATDTFLSGYIRAAEPGQLESLRHVVAGAESVKAQTRELWAKIGTEVLEGYGATECAPVLAANQIGANRPGTVGRFLPGIETRLEPVPGLTEGQRLFVRGPNVMAGYLRADRPGVLVPPDSGWHDTGDIVTVDNGGYVTIRGRAKRFAKLGGEMVSLGAIESIASGLWPNAQHVALSLPDARKGEQLVLVTDKPDASKDALLEYARKEGFPELWVPKALLVVASIPVLATGKVDLQATREMARKVRPLL